MSWRRWVRDWSPGAAARRPAAGQGSRSDASQRPPASAAEDALEARVQEIGREWLEAARSAGATRSGSEWLVERAMRERAFKVQLFRLVDVFPTLHTAEQVHAVLVEYLTQPGVELPPGVDLGLRAARVAKGTASRAIARQIESMAQSFIAGAEPRQALAALRARWEQGVAFSVDLLGEACVSDAEAEAYQARYLELVDALADEVAAWPAQPELERDAFGALPRANVSIKLSALDPHARSPALERSADRLCERLAPILERAAARDVAVCFDMEQYALRELVLRVFERSCERHEFTATIVLQAYLRESEADAERLLVWAQRAGRCVSVRLVKGAYWDSETIGAELEGWPSPVWSRKPETDACFERLSARLIGAAPRAPGEAGLRLALGTHNVRSIAVALAQLERAGLPPEALELQMLYGMAQPLKAVARAHGLRLREYVPVGALVPGMAYLVRRLLENTSNESWLRAGFSESVPDAELLAPPAPAASSAEREGDAQAQRAAARRHALSAAPEGVGDGLPFRTEPARDFSRAPVREAFGAALRASALPEPPADLGRKDLDGLLETALAAFESWCEREPRERAAALIGAARRMRVRRDELCGLVIRENGKTWGDADGEVCEAIDFLEYYAREAVALGSPQRLGRFAGEHNEPIYEGRGVAAVIAPWNFPLAISCGMSAAALVMGNAVVLKPAEQTPRIARVLVELLWDAGVPRDVLQLAAGPGEIVGAGLVRDPRVSLIAFTGSKAVGFDILEAAAHVAERQPHVKRVICEMGGKNAIVVDDTADLDEAVLGVRASAFGFQGQKCSACSRLIALDGIYDALLERLVESTRSLVIGDPLDPDTELGPLIDADATRVVREYIEIGRAEGELELAVDAPPGLEARVGRPFVGPHIFSGIERGHRLATDEIFGPVLAVMRAPSFDAALEEVRASPYRLTAGLFSRQPSHLERARRELRVGNLYLNRGITGARVARQPFGGLGWSGVGAPAGGRDYLLQFAQLRTVCENTLRRGFSPEL